MKTPLTTKLIVIVGALLLSLVLFNPTASHSVWPILLGHPLAGVIAFAMVFEPDLNFLRKWNLAKTGTLEYSFVLVPFPFYGWVAEPICDRYCAGRTEWSTRLWAYLENAHSTGFTSLRAGES